LTVFAIIPVHNRLEHTRGVLAALRKQTVIESIRIVVVDDGSTDGTWDYLSSQHDVIALSGDGNLWWAGAIQLGLKRVLPTAAPTDFVLFLNNDTQFAEDYVATLITACGVNGDIAVGSAIVEDTDTTRIVSIGPRCDIWRLGIWDIFNELSPEEKRSPKALYDVDALSGRGTIYPVSLFRRYGLMKPFLLPHYRADYELAMRFARDGHARLLVSTTARVISPPVYGNATGDFSTWQRLFSRRSSANVLYALIFFSLIGSPLQRATAPLRLAYRLARDRARKPKA